MALHEFIKIAGLKNAREFYSRFPDEDSFFHAYPEAKKMQMGGYTSKKAHIKVNYDQMPDWFNPNMFEQPVPSLNNNQGYVPQPFNAIPVPPMAGPSKSIEFDKTHSAIGVESYQPVFQGPWDRYSVHDYWNNVPQAFGNTPVQTGLPIEEQMVFKYGGTWINENATGYQMGGQVDVGKQIGNSFLDYLKSTRQPSKKSIPDRSTPNSFRNTTETDRGPYPQGYEPAGEECLECNEAKMQMGGDIFEDIDEYKKGGHWIPKDLKKGRCTPLGNPDCRPGTPQYNLAVTFKKHHGFHKKQMGGSTQPPQWEQLLATAGIVGNYFNSENRYKDLQSQTRQQGMSDSLYANTINPAGVKGDYTQQGMFRPNQQVINQPGAFYQIGGQIQMPVVAPTPDLSQYSAGPQIQSQPQVNEPIGSFKGKVPDSAKRAFSFYTQQGLPSHVAAGIVGNLYQESSLNPEAVNPTSGAFGVGQWLGKRKTAFMNYTKQNNLNPYNLETQLGYILNEPGESQKALSALANTTTPGQAAKVFADVYERMGKGEANYGKRVGLAQKLFTGPSYKEGGEVEMSPEELRQFMAMGGEVDFC